MKPMKTILLNVWLVLAVAGWGLIAFQACDYTASAVNDPAFKQWVDNRINDAATASGKAVSDALGVTDQATVDQITASIRSATGESADALRAALAAQGQARNAALAAWAVKFLNQADGIAAIAAGGATNPLGGALVGLIGIGAAILQKKIGVTTSV